MFTRWKLLLAATALLGLGTLGSSIAPRAASADAEIDVSVFYTSLSPHGRWVHIQPYGWSWVPENVTYGWRPYTVGHWVWVEPYGWTWASEEPWGWATYHYGRWTWADDYGWAWVPGTTWAPAWVAFRYGDPWIGWAPLAPGAGWRVDSGFDAGVNLEVSIGAFAWTFVQTRYFAEPNLRSRVLVSAYSRPLLERTRWSTRYAPVSGGYANLGVDVGIVEKARGEPVARRRLREAAAAERGSGTEVEGDAVVLYRPRIAAKASAQPPPQRARGERGDLAAWTAKRKAALQAHLEAERKALEQPAALPALPGAPEGDAAKLRAEALKELEEQQKRLEAQLEKQRKHQGEDDAKNPPSTPEPSPTPEPAPKPNPTPKPMPEYPPQPGPKPMPDPVPNPTPQPLPEPKPVPPIPGPKPVPPIPPVPPPPPPGMGEDPGMGGGMDGGGMDDDGGMDDGGKDDGGKDGGGKDDDGGMK